MSAQSACDYKSPTDPHVGQPEPASHKGSIQAATVWEILSPPGQRHFKVWTVWLREAGGEGRRDGDERSPDATDFQRPIQALSVPGHAA